MQTLVQEVNLVFYIVMLWDGVHVGNLALGAVIVIKRHLPLFSLQGTKALHTRRWQPCLQGVLDTPEMVVVVELALVIHVNLTDVALTPLSLENQT